MRKARENPEMILTVAHPLDKILECLCKFSRLKKKKRKQVMRKKTLTPLRIPLITSVLSWDAEC